MSDETRNQYSDYNPNAKSNTYGMQSELKRFQLRDHINSQQTIALPEADRDDMLDDDILVTNAIGSSGSGRSDFNSTNIVNLKDDEMVPMHGEPLTAPPVGPIRYVRDVRSAYNIDSRNRQRYHEQEFKAKDPVSGKYLREVIDANNQAVLEEFTADDLNIEWVVSKDQCIINPFIQKNGNIYFRTNCYPTASVYQIQLPKTLNNVKSIELTASQVPNPFTTINDSNNKIYIEIIDCLTDCPLELSPCDRGLPFFYILVPIGDYDLLTLLGTIEMLVNKTIRKRSKEAIADMFKITGDPITGRITIRSKEGYKFHWRFEFGECKPGIGCASTASGAANNNYGNCDYNEEVYLYYMLGFAQPFLRDKRGCNMFVTKWSNHYRFQDDCNEHIDSFKRPFRPINLHPNRYMYLLLQGQGNETTMQIGSMTDLNQPGQPIFAKFYFPTQKFGEIAYNVYITLTMFFPIALRMIDKIKVAWVDECGRPINFYGMEHCFTIVFTQYIDNLSLANFSPTRGLVDITSFTSKERILSYGDFGAGDTTSFAKY